MFNLGDLFQWERFVTPSIIRVFYGLAVIAILLEGLSSAGAGFAGFQLNPVRGLVTMVASIVGMLAAIMLTRILAEFILVTFRINEHLGAFRDRLDSM
ncbi:MAG: DUF4282 domain-containing protein [Proteobacteria bacterium]|nr:DUF4282 domain-containing protein [Pseudomonadota bacterium]